MRIGSQPSEAILALARELGVSVNLPTGRRSLEFKALRESVITRQLVDGMTWQQAIAAELEARKL